MPSRPTVSPPSAPRTASPPPRSQLYHHLHVLMMLTRCLTIVVITGNVLFMIYLLYLGRPNEIMNDSTSYYDIIPTRSSSSSSSSLQYLDQMIQETFPVVSSSRRDLATTTHNARQISSPVILLHAVAPAAPAAAAADHSHHRSTTSGNPAHLRRVRPARKHQRRQT